MTGNDVVVLEGVNGVIIQLCGNVAIPRRGESVKVGVVVSTEVHPLGVPDFMTCMHIASSMNIKIHNYNISSPSVSDKARHQSTGRGLPSIFVIIV